MSDSDRYSGREVEPTTNYLANRTEVTNSGADDNAILTTNNARNGRIGQRQLTRIKSSLSDRQLSILVSLGRLRILSGRHVERLLYPVTEFTALSAARSSRRDLAQLYQLQLVDRLDRRIGGLRAGSGSFLYTLSPLGARLLGHTARRRSREPSLAHLDHVLDVAELVIRLHESARAGRVDLVQVQTEPDCWRPLVGPHGSRLTLKPDLRVTLGVEDKELHWFIEIDRGSEHRPVLVRKCQVYVSAWRDGREQAQSGVFPRVLWVVPDTERETVVRRVAERQAGAPSGMFMTTTNDRALSVLLGQGDQR